MILILGENFEGGRTISKYESEFSSSIVGLSVEIVKSSSRSFFWAGMFNDNACNAHAVAELVAK
jgi:hypothetical protein